MASLIERRTHRSFFRTRSGSEEEQRQSFKGFPAWGKKVCPYRKYICVYVDVCCSLMVNCRRKRGGKEIKVIVLSPFDRSSQSAFFAKKRRKRKEIEIAAANGQIVHNMLQDSIG